MFCGAWILSCGTTAMSLAIDRNQSPLDKAFLKLGTTWLIVASACYALLVTAIFQRLTHNWKADELDVGVVIMCSFAAPTLFTWLWTKIEPFI